MTGLFKTVGSQGFADYEVADGTMRPTSAVADHLLVPGFVDIHIHGGFGFDLMAGDTAGLLTWCDRLAEQGYEGFLPTTVTASANDVKAAIAKLPSHPMVLGFHLEGPFISRKFPGAQPQAFIAAPPEPGSEWDEVLDDPRLKVVTMAPEEPGALQLIRRLRNRGVIVSMGHTNSTFAEASAGHEAGAIHTTHTYNAMRPLHHREAGTVGFALSQDSLTTELIYDRHHVCRDAAALLLKNKPADRIIAVSDGTQAAGMPDGQTLKMWNLDCVVRDGQVRLLDGTLAGSAITLLDAFRNLASDFGPEVAIRACSLNPRTALGLNASPKVWLVFNKQLDLVEIAALLRDDLDIVK